MKVYVDKLPKSCNDCVIDHCGEWCCLNGVEIDTWSYNETRPKECPLRTLAEHDKQVRKEVCDEISKRMANEFPLDENEPMSCFEDHLYYQVLPDIIKGETNET